MSGIDVLVVGNGGREYELARQLSGSSAVNKVYVAPGNAGTAKLPRTQNVAIAATNIEDIVGFVAAEGIKTVVIGPEAPLVAGLADPLRDDGVAVFGPSHAAAQLEGSKAFAAEFMRRHDISQPQSDTAYTLDEALKIIEGRQATSYVLKADGIASGKGVVLPATDKEAKEVLAAMFGGSAYGGGGKSGVVIQERLSGPEVSAFAVSDGVNIVMLPFAQDHKRLQDNDQGPNTGGMGAYAPVPESIVNTEQTAKIHDIITRTIAGMKADGVPFEGVLFVGLMLAAERSGDPVVIEYNVRFGDPEAEVQLTLLSEEGFDVAAMLLQAAEGDISGIAVPGKLSKTAVSVCLAPSGYPEKARSGDEIHGLEKSYENVIVHQAGTKQDGDKILAPDGRVLYVTGFGDTYDEAAAHAYAAIGEQGVHFEGMQYRTDIGHQVRSK